MGLCQSKSADQFVDGSAVHFAKDRTNRNMQSIKSTPSGGKASYAYDLALISPSERTAVTNAISPTSMFSPDIANISPIKKESHFDFVIEVDESEKFSSPDGLEDLCSRIVKAPFPDLDSSNFGVQRKESFNDEDNHVLGSNDFINLLTAKEDEFTASQLTEENASYSRYNPPTSICETVVNNYEFETNFPSNQKMMEDPAQPMIQANLEVIENYNSPKLDNGGLDYFGSYQKSSKFDAPPLLAPPNDVAVVAEPTNTYTAVNPSIVANFNKMKLHVNEVQKEEKKRRRQEKIQDRRRDIEGYNELWGKYNEIQKRVITEHSNIVVSPSPKKENEKVSLADATTWFVDFSALNPTANPLVETRSVDDQETVENDDTKNQTNLPFLIESSAFYSRHDTFGQEYFEQQKRLLSKPAVSEMAYSYSPKHPDIHESTTVSQNDYDRDRSEDDENKSIPVTMDLDLGTRSTSIISDLGNGSNSSIASESSRAFDNDDYGVLGRYSRRSIESSVPTHTENFNAKFGKQSPHDAIPLVMDPKSLKENNKTSSFSNYLAKNCLPSVCIEDAETGLVRWRESTKSSVELGEACRDDGNESF